LKQALAERGIPVIPNPSHIVPVLVGDAAQTKAASDLLLTQHGIYVQGINYPTVSRGEERLRITPTPGHADHTGLVQALESVWDTLGLKRVDAFAREGGRCGVGVIDQVAPIWTDSQLQRVETGRSAKSVGVGCREEAVSVDAWNPSELQSSAVA